MEKKINQYAIESTIAQSDVFVTLTKVIIKPCEEKTESEMNYKAEYRSGIFIEQIKEMRNIFWEAKLFQ